MRAWVFSSDETARAIELVLAPLGYELERAAKSIVPPPSRELTLLLIEWTHGGDAALELCSALTHAHAAPLLVLLDNDDRELTASILAGGAADVIRLPADGARLAARALAAARAPHDSHAATAATTIAATTKATTAKAESDIDWREAFERCPFPTVIFGSESTAILAVNEAMVRAYGWTRAELLKMTLRDLRPASELARFDAMVASCSQAPPPENWIHQRKDGSWLDVEVTSQPISFGGRSARIAVIHDVSKHVRAAETYRRERFDYRQFIERTPDAVFTYAPDGRIVDGNPAFVTLLGYASIKDLIGRHVTEVIDPDDHEEVRARMRTTLVSRQSTMPGPIRFLAADGAIRWTETRGIRVTYEGGHGVTVIARDLSERRAADEELRLSEERFSKIFNASPACMTVTRMSDDVFIDVNDRFLSVMGFTRDQLVGHTGIGVGLWQAPADRARLAEAVRAGVKPRDVSVRLLRRSGEPIDFLMSLEPLTVDGEACVVALGNDVTERSRLEEQLRQTQKMDAIGRLAGGVAHDFNNLLTAIRGYCELLLQDLPPDTPARNAAAHIHRSTLRATSLTGQLLALTRRQPHQPRVLVLNDVVTSMGALLSRIIGEDITLDVRLARDLGRVRVDPTQVEQVLLNLAVNAREAMARGGRLSIETANFSDGSGHHVRLSVRDSGRGMSEETRRRVFEPFFTTKEIGTGLGLSIVYGVVVQNGGSISVESSPGHGAAFNILLPRVDEAVTPEIAPPPPPVATGGRETILLVEDDEDVREFVGYVLRLAGYSVLTAEDAAMALRIAREHAGAIDLLVSDVIMPQVNGIELAAQLLPVIPSLKVLHMSGYPGESIARHGEIPAGAAFLQKPFSAGELTAAVRKVLETADRS